MVIQKESVISKLLYQTNESKLTIYSFQGSQAKFQHPLDVKCYLNSKQNENEFLLVADTYNNCLKKIDVKKKKVEKILLVNEAFTLNEPSGICVDYRTDTLFLADTNHHSIKIVKDFNINSQKFSMEEFQIKFTTSGLPKVEELRISNRKKNDYQLCSSFRFKLNSNAENTWKLAIKGSHAACINGSFKSKDLIECKKDSYVYKLDDAFVDKSWTIDKIRLDLNLIYCGNDLSCKILKKSFDFNKKEIQSLLSQASTEPYILLKILE